MSPEWVIDAKIDAKQTEFFTGVVLYLISMIYISSYSAVCGVLDDNLF